MDNDKEIGIYEAKNKLSALVEEAARGRRIWITKRGQRVAQLTAVAGRGSQPELSLLEAFGRIRAEDRPDGGRLKDLVEEGRR